MMYLKPEIELVTSSGEILLENLSHFKVGLKVRNRSGRDLLFDVSETTLLVNDKRCFAWDLAVQNGTIVNFKVLPFQQKSVEWPLGRALFETPGKYKLELRWKEVTKSCNVLVSV